MVRAHAVAYSVYIKHASYSREIKYFYVALYTFGSTVRSYVVFYWPANSSRIVHTQYTYCTLRELCIEIDIPAGAYAQNWTTKINKWAAGPS